MAGIPSTLGCERKQARLGSRRFQLPTHSELITRRTSPASTKLLVRSSFDAQPVPFSPGKCDLVAFQHLFSSRKQSQTAACDRISFATWALTLPKSPGAAGRALVHLSEIVLLLPKPEERKKAARFLHRSVLYYPLLRTSDSLNPAHAFARQHR